MSNYPTRQGVEAAAPLDFAANAARDAKLTIHAQCEGWPIDVAASLPLDKLPALLERLAAAGLQPAGPSAPPATPSASTAKSPAKGGRGRVAPSYGDDGAPCCPVHGAPLRDGKWGLFCPARDDGPDSRNGYCGLKFAE